ncbi:hypothetical protein [Halobacillus massiliensis]|uniref:hypothetical protein n=1 Tax=Halobacillus massiliensis TaxID=1926286 RepID=UPI0009E3B5BA|nr:hypothetical protein [Halobacillus massiliensis]
MTNDHSLKIVNPASASIIMALGVFLYAAIEALPFFHLVIGQVLTGVLAVFGIIIYSALARQLFRGFFYSLLKNPVNSFVIGSWIAGLSVLSEVTLKYYPDLLAAAQAIAVLNTGLYVLFMVICIYSFTKLIKYSGAHSPHGTVLLSTVATQSLVILWGDMFPFLPTSLLMTATLAGIVFYFIGIFLIGRRYKLHHWSIAEDWTSTNCIIHGALSITGLALIAAGGISPFFMLIYWLIVFSMVLLVELLEILRAVKRVRTYGWKEGVFTYNVSQWSRNFTFGMFYAFTMMRHEGAYYLPGMYDFHETLLSLGVWVVFFFLAAEIIVWAGSKWVSSGDFPFKI